MYIKKIIIHKELAEYNIINYLIDKGYILLYKDINLNQDEFQIICFDPMNNINILASVKYQEKEVLNNDLINSFIKQKYYLLSLIDNGYFKDNFNILCKLHVELYICCKEGIEHVSYISD